MTPPDVLSPARLGPVELRNRVIKAATFEGVAPLPQPARLALRLAGHRFLRSYPYQEAYLLDRARQFRAA